MSPESIWLQSYTNYKYIYNVFRFSEDFQESFQVTIALSFLNGFRRTSRMGGRITLPLWCLASFMKNAISKIFKFLKSALNPLCFKGSLGMMSNYFLANFKPCAVSCFETCCSLYPPSCQPWFTLHDEIFNYSLQLLLAS